MYSVNWVGMLCNVGLGFFVEWGGGGRRGEGVIGFFLEIIIYRVYGRTGKVAVRFSHIV